MVPAAAVTGATLVASVLSEVMPVPVGAGSESLVSEVAWVPVVVLVEDTGALEEAVALYVVC
jgi:hypothetical protein